MAFLPVLGQWGLAYYGKAQDNKASLLASAAVSVALAVLIGSILVLVHSAALAQRPSPTP